MSSEDDSARNEGSRERAHRLLKGETKTESDARREKEVAEADKKAQAEVVANAQKQADKMTADSAHQVREVERVRLETEKEAAQISEPEDSAPTLARAEETVLEAPVVPDHVAKPVVAAEGPAVLTGEIVENGAPLKVLQPDKSGEPKSRAREDEKEVLTQHQAEILTAVEAGALAERVRAEAERVRNAAANRRAEPVPIPPPPPESPRREASSEKKNETGNGSKEEKEKETKITWKQANEVLEQLGPQVGSPAMTAEQRQAFDRAKNARDEMVMEAKRDGLLGDILKDKVANAYDLAIREARLALQANNPTDNPREVFANRLRGIRPIREGEGRLEGVVESWFAGVERNLDLSITEGLASVREDLGMGEDKRLTKRAERLDNQIDVLNWGSLSRDETIDRLESMADLCVEWERRYGPRASDYKRAEESVAARPPGGVDRNGLSDLMGIKTVEVKEDASSTPLFEEGGYFLTKYALPEVIEFSTGGLEKYRRKTTYALTDAILNGRLDSLTGSREFRSDVRLQNFLVFMSPLLTFRDKIRGGGFKNLIGDETDATPSALGALPFRSTLIYLAGDQTFSRAVDIIMAADGGFGESFLSDEDKEFVDGFKNEFRDLMTHPGSNKEGGRVTGYSQKEATGYMDDLSVKITERLEIPGDVGVVYLARAMVAFMGHGLESTAMRNVGYFKQKDVVYRWVSQFRDKEGKPDLALEPALRKIRIKGTPGPLAVAYAEGGFAGVGAAAVNLNPGVDLNMWAFGMRKVTDGLEKIGRLINRGDSAQLAKDKAGVLKEIATTLGELTSGEIPQLGKETGEFVMRQAKEAIDPGGGALANETIQSHEEYMEETNRLADEISPTFVQRLRRFLGLRWRSG